MTVRNTSSLFDIAGKIVLITGATGGLGETAARGLAQIGANVMLTARSQDKLASIAASIVQEEGAAAYAAGRPDDAGDVRRVVEATVEIHQEDLSALVFGLCPAYPAMHLTKRLDLTDQSKDRTSENSLQSLSGNFCANEKYTAHSPLPQFAST